MADFKPCLAVKLTISNMYYISSEIIGCQRR